MKRPNKTRRKDLKVIAPQEEFYSKGDAARLLDIRELLLRRPELVGEDPETIAGELPGSPEAVVVAPLREVLVIEGCGVCP